MTTQKECVCTIDMRTGVVLDREAGCPVHSQTVEAFAEQLARAFEEKSAKVRDSIGIVDEALIAAAVWEGAARWTRKLAAGEPL